MAWTRRSATSIAAVVALAAAALGVGGAIAQDDAETPTGVDPTALLERLAALEPDLPQDPAPTEVTFDEDTTWGTLDSDAASVRALLDTLEPELRTLFIDADDADGEVAEAVALVAQGWLDVWSGSAAMGEAESNDLSFPLEATDDLGVSAGADELRGSMEVGLELVLQGRDRHLEGYGALQELNPAEPDAQARFDDRARAAERFDDGARSELVAMLSQPSTTVVVPTERFVTDAPGVRSRATSVTVVCIDRDALVEAGGLETEAGKALLAEAELENEECPPAPEPLSDDSDD